jgi:hypothetical protein
VVSKDATSRCFFPLAVNNSLLVLRGYYRKITLPYVEPAPFILGLKDSD